VHPSKSYNQQLSHRSGNSCAYNKISPIVENHFSPRTTAMDAGEIYNCGDVMKIAH